MQKTDVAVVPTMQTGGKVSPIVPQTWGEAVQMATAFVRAGMVPKHFENNIERATVAILAGLEVGLTPMSALQSIAVINNMPTIYGDGMLGLIRASGYLEDIEEGVEYNKQGQPVSATCRVKRKGENTWGVHMFTIEDAMKGGLLAKPGPWKQYPQRMLQMRARAWALRDKFADVLKGLKSAEEMQDMVDVTDVGTVTTAPPAPKRSDFVDSPASPPESSQTVPAGGADNGQPADSPAGAGSDSKPEAASSPAVTDAVDLNEKPGPEISGDPTDAPEPEAFEFETFRTFVAFNDFSEDFLQKTSPAGADAWLKHYQAKMDEFAKSKTVAIKQAAAFLMTLVEDAKKPKE